MPLTIHSWGNWCFIGVFRTKAAARAAGIHAYGAAGCRRERGGRSRAAALRLAIYSLSSWRTTRVPDEGSGGGRKYREARFRQRLPRGGPIEELQLTFDHAFLEQPVHHRRPDEGSAAGGGHEHQERGSRCRPSAGTTERGAAADV
ncbi:hypothetical protein [Paenibacillus elgii]|uniref:hypothetical protein n=1 Tax=Paenibacillus elgii TaxID=189691 RepID=UPI0013D4D132|nr:hypothetical protein [Paenibacillus elgii]